MREDFPAPVRPTMPICKGVSYNTIQIIEGQHRQQNLLHCYKNEVVYFFSAFYISINPLKDEIQAFSVPCGVVIEGHFAFIWPSSSWSCLIYVPLFLQKQNQDPIMLLTTDNSTVNLQLSSPEFTFVAFQTYVKT